MLTADREIVVLTIATLPPLNAASIFLHFPHQLIYDYTQVVSEICILERLSHTNIVKLQDVWCMSGVTTLVFEHGGRTVSEFLRSFGRLDVSNVADLMRQLCSGVAYIHGLDVIHNDLKPANLLLDALGVLRVCDFGSSVIDRSGWRHLPSESTIRKEGLREMTPWYRAPEVILGHAAYTRAVDLWSVGCIMSELSTAQPLFRFDRNASTMQMIGQVFEMVGKPRDDVIAAYTRNELIKSNCLAPL